MAAKMSDAELSRKAGRLILSRKAKNKLKRVAADLSGQIIEEMNHRGITTYKAPKGDLTKYETTPRSISAEDLFNQVGQAALQVMSVSVAEAIEVFGESLLSGILVEGETKDKVLTKPAQKSGKVITVVP